MPKSRTFLMMYMLCIASVLIAVAIIVGLYREQFLPILAMIYACMGVAIGVLNILRRGRFEKVKNTSCRKQKSRHSESCLVIKNQHR